MIQPEQIQATEPPDACPGPCNRDYRHTDHNRDDVPYTPGQPIWCPSCRDTITTKLGNLIDLAAHLPPGRLNTPRNVDTKESKNLKASTHPSASPAWDALDALIRWAIHLEDDTRARLRHSPNTDPYRTLTQAIRYLTGNITAVLADDTTGEQSGHAVLHHHRTLTRITGTDRPVARIPGECPACKKRATLRRQDGHELITCRACGATWDWDYYQHLTKVLVDQARSAG